MSRASVSSAHRCQSALGFQGDQGLDIKGGHPSQALEMHRQRRHIAEESGMLATALQAQAHVPRRMTRRDHRVDAGRDLAVAIKQAQLARLVQRLVIR